MAELDEIENYTADGYLFMTKTEYDEAVQEKKAIKYLNSQIDLNNISKTYQLYTELIEKHVFSTPIGMDFLKQLRTTLLKSNRYTMQELLAIPVPTSGKNEKKRVEKYIGTKYEASLKKYEQENKKLKAKIRTAVFSILVLVAVIIAMFVISRNTSSVNILNYERKLQDKYSAWEQELKDREQVIKDKEKQLGIQ